MEALDYVKTVEKQGWSMNYEYIACLVCGIRLRGHTKNGLFSQRYCKKYCEKDINVDTLTEF